MNGRFIYLFISKGQRGGRGGVVVAASAINVANLFLTTKGGAYNWGKRWNGNFHIELFHGFWWEIVVNRPLMLDQDKFSSLLCLPAALIMDNKEWEEDGTRAVILLRNHHKARKKLTFSAKLGQLNSFTDHLI